MIKYLICLMLCTSMMAADYDKMSGYYKVSGDDLKLLVTTCNTFIEKQKAEDDLQKWTKKIKSQVEQKLKDNDTLSEESAFQNIALDWLAGSESKLKEKDKGAIKYACFMFLYFIEHDILLPNQLRDRFEKKNLDKFVKVLEEMT